jgi:hypothetical protein
MIQIKGVALMENEGEKYVKLMEVFIFKTSYPSALPIESHKWDMAC